MSRSLSTLIISSCKEAALHPGTSRPPGHYHQEMSRKSQKVFGRKKQLTRTGHVSRFYQMQTRILVVDRNLCQVLCKGRSFGCKYWGWKTFERCWFLK